MMGRQAYTAQHGEKYFLHPWDLILSVLLGLFTKGVRYMASDNQQAFGWFVAGLGIGALVGILYAPKSGCETREDIVVSA